MSEKRVVPRRDHGKPSSRRTTGKDEEDGEEELEVFERRAEWFRQFHGDRLGVPSAEGRVQAIAQADRLGSIPAHERDPGGARPPKGFELIGSRKAGASLRLARNPRPKSSFGFAGSTVEVRAKGDLRGSTLKISLDAKLVRGVDPTSVRVFRFEESTRGWALVARSGASSNGGYAWAQIRRPGLYVPVGVPEDPWLLRTVLAIDTYMPWLRAARKMNGLGRLLDPICKLILCGGTFGTARGDPALAGQFDLPPFGGGGNVCDRCLGLDLPNGGLPEAQILKIPPSISLPRRIWPFFCPRWISAGPDNFSGRIKCLAIHPSNGKVLYAGSADGGVWKTTDGGTSWYSTMQIELSMAIGAIGISASSPDILYAATGEDVPGYGPSYPGVGVYKTTNGGADWDLLPSIPSIRCTRLLVHPADPNTVYVAGSSGLHRSTDGGATWTTLRIDHVSDALMDPLTPDTIYVGVWNSGVFRSTSGGAAGSWTLLNNGLPSGAAADWIKLAMGLNGVDGTAFLVAKMGTDSGQLYSSTDGGANWSRIAGTHQPASYNEWTNLIAVDPNDQDVLFAGAIGLERSADGGVTFVANYATHSDHHALLFSPADSKTCYLATDGGVYKSTDNGKTWVISSVGLVSTQLYTIGVAQVWPFVMGGGTQDQGIIKSDGSYHWVDTGAGNEGGFFIVDPNDTDNIYVTPWSSNLRRSTDGGTTWTTILTGLPAGMVVGHLAVKPGDSNVLLCVGGSQVFRSTDQGATWNSVLTTNGGAVHVAFSPSSATVCYVVTNSGRLYRSTAGGGAASWTEPYAAADKPPYGLIGGIGVGWNDPNLLYIAYAGWTGGSHIWRSEDGGVHWANAGGALPSDALPNIPVSALVVDQYNPEVVYASTDIGVFRTRDAGDSWEKFGEGMPRIVTSDMTLHKSSNTLYASTMGRGAYKRSLG